MIRGVMDWTESGAKRALAHPELNPGGQRAVRIGRGTFAAVYESTEPGRVLKVTVDKYAYMAHVDPVCRIVSEYMPRVYRRWGEIGEYRGRYPIYMVELERLEPAHCCVYDEGDERLCRATVRQIRSFARMFGDHCVVDIHSQNVMRRPGTGDLILSDPLCDQEMINCVGGW